MGFKIYYRSTRRLSPARADAIHKATTTLIAGRTWLSCEPVGFRQDEKTGRLCGGSKPNFDPHPDDVQSAAAEQLPDGTVSDMLDVLCQLSADFKVDWELSHEHHPGPVGFIRGGMCDRRLREQIEAIGDLGGVMRELIEDGDMEAERDRSPRANSPVTADDEEDDDDDGEPTILPFRPRGS